MSYERLRWLVVDRRERGKLIEKLVEQGRRQGLDGVGDGRPFGKDDILGWLVIDRTISGISFTFAICGSLESNRQ